MSKLFVQSILCVFVSLNILNFHSIGVESAPFVDSIIGAVAGKAPQWIKSTLFDSGNVSFNGYQCQYTMRPTFKSWRIHKVAKFWCPGLASFSGSASHVSKDGALGMAQKDYAQKLVDAKLLPRNQLAGWL